LLRFEPWEGVADGTFCYDFLGVRTDPRFRPQFRPQPAGSLKTEYPPPHAAYFEIAFVLDSVLAAGDGERFTMLELGAGYGPWLVLAHRAMRLGPGRPTRLIGVEMVPHHFRWMHEHFRNNEIDPDEHRLLHAAVSDVAGEALYRPEPDRRLDFGQKVIRRVAGSVPAPPGDASVDDDAGRPIAVPCVTLESLLEEIGDVDLMHVDVQGEELRALGPAIDRLSSRVRRLLVATHSRRIHRTLRRRLRQAGWETTFDFGVRARERTPFGDVQFLDGMLAVVNRRRSC
jgi:FkbM family methyltransferase